MGRGLAIFAIRLGVPVRRTVELLYKVPFSQHFALMSHRSPREIQDFITAACRADRRAWEHSLTVLGSVAVALVTRLNLEVPQNLEYLKDWASIAAWNVAEHPIEATVDLEDVPTLAELTPSFRAHLDAALALNVPATGPFRYVLPGAVNAGLLTRDEAIALAFDALAYAVRPGDRKQWVAVLRESLQVSDKELLERFDLLVPVIATGEAAMVEALALPLFPLINDEQLGELALCSLYVTTVKAKKAVLHALAARSRPSDETVDMCVPRLQEMAAMRDTVLVKQATAVLLAWGVQASSATDSEEEDSTSSDSDTELRGGVDTDTVGAHSAGSDSGGASGLWQTPPPLWELPRWRPPKPSFDTLSRALGAFVQQPDGDPTLELESFLSAAVELAYTDVEAARRALQGCPRSLLGGAPYDWVRKGATEWNPYSSHEPSPHYVRPRALIRRMGSLPCVLSTPSYVDFTLSIEDLCERLDRYAKERVPVLASDLVVALMRLDIRDTPVADVQASVHDCDVPVLIEDGTRLERSAGQVVANYVADPLVEPSYSRDASAWGGWHMEAPVIPASLQGFPLTSMESRYFSPSVSEFPLWQVVTSYTLTWSQEVDHELGLRALQVARQRQPLSPPMAMNLLACQRPSKKADVTAACAQALHDAWSRGLLQPGVADVEFLDWHQPLSHLAFFAAAMRECVHEGFLSVIWPVCDDLLSYGFSQPRMPAGTADIADVMAEFAPAVVTAIASGVASAKAAAVPGLRALAARSGSSKAVVAARNAVTVLPEAPEAPQTRESDSEEASSGASSSQKKSPAHAEKSSFDPLGEEDFAQQWPLPAGTDPQTFTAQTFLSDQAEEVWNDGVVITAVQVGEVPGRRAIRLDMSFPERSGILEVMEVGWFYSLLNEGQVRGSIQSADGSDSSPPLWIHWNGARDWSFASERNWRGGSDGPLEGAGTDLSPALAAVVLAAQCYEGEPYSARAALSNLALEKSLPPALVGEAMRRLLPFEDFSPARVIYVLERKPHVLPVLWPILTESLRAAGKIVAVGQAPPRWANAVLNVVQAHSQLLLSATLRGFIPPSEWEGINLLAATPKKSAAREKALRLLPLVTSTPEEMR